MSLYHHIFPIQPIALYLILYISNGHCHDNYTPSDHVKQAHQIPHLDWQLNRRSNTFDLSSSSEANSYGKSLITLPIIIIVIIAAAVILFQLIILLRTLYEKCRGLCKCFLNCGLWCCGREGLEKKKLGEKRKRPYILSTCALLLCGIFASNCVILKGNNDMNNGVNTIQDGLDFISDIARGVEGSLNLMADDSLRVAHFLDDNSCGSYDEELEDIATYVREFDGAVNVSQSYTRSVPKGIDIANSHLDTYAVNYKNDVVITFVCAIFVLILVFSLSIVSNNAFVLKVCILVTEALIIALAGIACVEMVMVMAVSDFCYHPAESIFTLTPSGYIEDVARYYTLCSGRDPLEGPMDDARTYAENINKTLDQMQRYDDISTACYNQIEDILPHVSDTFSEIVNVLEYAQCQYLHEVWVTVVNDGFCGDTFSGFYILWTCQFAIVACLYVVIVLSAVLYPDFKGRFLRTICACCYTNTEYPVTPNKGVPVECDDKCDVDVHCEEYEMIVRDKSDASLENSEMILGVDDNDDHGDNASSGDYAPDSYQVIVEKSHTCREEEIIYV